MIHKHHVAKLFSSQQAIKHTGCIGGLAEVAHQGRGQHVLNQAGLTRTTDAGDAHQTAQRNVHTHAFEVVLRHAFQDQARRVLHHQASKAHADLLASAQIGPRERVGVTQVIGRAIKHNLPTTLTRTGAHVDHAVSSQHHSRVMLHHHQGVARVAQALHGFDDAVHVARVQADARLVQHKQGVHQRGAQGRGQVDALHFAAGEGTALTIQRQVADAHVAQVFEAGADFFMQKLEGLLLAGPRMGGILQLHSVKEAPQPLNRQLHQIVQAQARQGFKLRARPCHTRGHEALRRIKHSIRVFLASNTPEQALSFQARTATGAAGRVAAVLGQQHPDVHLVGLALQIFKETLDAKPVLVPLAVPVGRAVDDPGLLLRRELVPRGVSGNARSLGVAHQIVLRLFPGWGLHGFDGTGTQGHFDIRNHQPVIDPDDAPKTTADLARPNG